MLHADYPMRWIWVMARRTANPKQTLIEGPGFTAAYHVGHSDDFQPAKCQGAVVEAEFLKQSLARKKHSAAASLPLSLLDSLSSF